MKTLIDGAFRSKRQYKLAEVLNIKCELQGVQSR